MLVGPTTTSMAPPSTVQDGVGTESDVNDQSAPPSIPHRLTIPPASASSRFSADSMSFPTSDWATILLAQARTFTRRSSRFNELFQMPRCRPHTPSNCDPSSIMTVAVVHVSLESAKMSGFCVCAVLSRRASASGQFTASSVKISVEPASVSDRLYGMTVFETLMTSSGIESKSAMAIGREGSAETAVTVGAA